MNLNSGTGFPNFGPRTLNYVNFLFIYKMKVKQKSIIEAFSFQSRIRNSTIIYALLTVNYFFLPISESILVIYCCITSKPKFSCLSDTFIISKFLFIKHLGMALFDALLYNSLTRLQLKRWPGVESV